MCLNTDMHAIQKTYGTPGMMASKLSQPPRTPPACLSISSFRLILSSSSTVQGLLTCPLMQYSLVPWLFLRPNCVNHSGPLRRMVGATATVSTLVTVEGQPYRPTLAGNGGLSLGFPCLPSRDSIKAVSSPAYVHALGATSRKMQQALSTSFCVYSVLQFVQFNTELDTQLIKLQP